MKKMMRYMILFLSVMILAACTPNEPSVTEEPNQEEQKNQEEEVPVEEEPTEEFESQIEDTIVNEGMEEPITLNLYESDASPFITYVPADFVAEETSGDEGDSHWFYTNYEGERNEDIYLQVYFFSETMTEKPSTEDPDGTYANFLQDMELVTPEERMYDWALEEYISPEGSRQALLSEHNGQYFVMILNSTPEYSAGFVPRANKIIEHFYWTDTQEYLAQ